MVLMESAVASSAVPPRKFSRYKSVRNAPSSTQMAPAGSASETSTTASKVSMCRYKSARIVSSSKDQTVDSDQTKSSLPTDGVLLGALPKPQASRPTTAEQRAGSNEGLRRNNSIEEARDEAYRKLTGESLAQAISPWAVGASQRSIIKAPSISRQHQSSEMKAAASGFAVIQDQAPAIRHQHQPSEVKTTGSGNSSQSRTPLERIPSKYLNWDMPLSAINAGQRTVIVQIGATRYDVDVTATSTCHSVLERAVVVCPEVGDVQHAMLVECYSLLGLERPLRRYESIRHVTSSWDKPYHFRIETSTSDQELADLEIQYAPQQPGSISVYLSCSTRPRVWKKLWVTLDSDGIISHSKFKRRDPNDSTTICHLSDFEIFTPTKKQLKVLNPGDRFCFAIKSMAPRARFMAGEHFVYFYASTEHDAMNAWYREVHRWRSWHLVHVLGGGRETEPAQASRGHSQKTSTVTQTSKPSSQTPEITSLFRSPTQPATLLSKIPSVDDAAFTGGLLALRLNSLSSAAESPLNLHRSATQRVRASSGPLVDAIPSRDEDAFTGGLLSRLPAGQGGRHVGRGVRSGSRGMEPLIDLKLGTEYVPGSLLAGVKAEESNAPRHAIDRGKRTEGVVRTGEGL